MKFYVSIILLTLTYFLNINAQDSEEINQLKPVKKPTKAELKKQKKLSNIDVCPLGADIADLSVVVESKILADGKKLSVIKAEINSYSLALKKMENGETVASVNIFAKVTSNDEIVNGIFEDAVNFPLPKERVDKPNALYYQKTFELPKGKYILRFLVRENETGISGYKSVKFEVN